MFEITREHADYTSRKVMYKKYRDLYTGGEQLKASAAEYLAPRQKEPAKVYGDRLERVFYENYIGSIVDWYAATLFRREPLISFTDAEDASERFFSEFIEDCDLKGTGLTDYFRQQFIDAVVFGSSFTLVDFPGPAVHAANRAQEDEAGSSRAYLVQYTPEHITNWGRDERGNLDWAVVRTDRPTGNPGEIETTWTLYDRERFARYRSSEKGPELVGSGKHGLAKQRRVPLVEFRLPEGFWLMNKAGLLQLEHFNKSNSLAWALSMGLFAMPVIYSERDFTQVVGESYFLQLGPEDKFGWTEPGGHVYQIAAENLRRLKEEIYRVCYLMSQASSDSGGNPESALSKQRDYAITQEMLRAYGDVVKDTIKRVLGMAAQARGDAMTIDVSGLDEFDIGDFSAEMDDAERLLTICGNSPTLRSHVLKRLAAKYLCDVRHDVKQRIFAEIDAV